MSDCPKCKRPFSEGNSPNAYECNGTDDDEGLCEAYAKNAALRQDLDLALMLLGDAGRYSSGGCKSLWCNGVHAENGACEGDYQASRCLTELFDKYLPKPPLPPFEVSTFTKRCLNCGATEPAPVRTVVGSCIKCIERIPKP